MFGNMLDIQALRTLEPHTLVIGSPQPAIIQSILDYDYLIGRKSPTVLGIVVNTRSKKYERYFWGTEEVLIPCFLGMDSVPQSLKEQINLFLNMNSGRRALESTQQVFQLVPNSSGGVIFAENMPEKHALELYQISQTHNKWIIGPASVGIVIPGALKLGPIAGLLPEHQLQSGIFTPGDTAVLSASGGMVGEVITVLAQAGVHLSFSLTFGGDRFPILTPSAGFLAAQADPHTKNIVYYGELGGTDEYDIVELIKQKKFTKPVYAYIAGTISEMFETPPQFGHAKAMAKKGDETAQAKRKVLADAGVQVASTFEEFVKILHTIRTSPSVTNHPSSPPIRRTDPLLTSKGGELDYINKKINHMEQRKKRMFVSSVSGEKDGMVQILGQDLLQMAETQSFAYIVGSMFLGKKIRSKELAACIDLILKLVVDNGPYQSGPVNTIITTRAGRDMVSALSAGLLTIGPRFGGATNEAAANWLYGVKNNIQAHEFVESFVKQGQIIEGIGHLKHRVDFPDPRVSALKKFAEQLSQKKYLSFALEVEKVTTAKKGSLILNVDGTLAAVLLDLLAEKEGFSEQELQELVDNEFFNAFFVLSRSVGLIAHYLDQKRLDPGLFRLSAEEVSNISEEVRESEKSE